MAPKKNVKISAEVDLSVKKKEIDDLVASLKQINKEIDAKRSGAAISQSMQNTGADKIYQNQLRILTEMQTAMTAQLSDMREAVKLQRNLNAQIRKQIKEAESQTNNAVNVGQLDKAIADAKREKASTYKVAGKNTPVKIGSPLNASASLPNLEAQTAKVNALKAKALQFKGDEVEMAAIAFQAIKEEELLSALIEARVSFNRQLEGKANESDDKKIVEVTNKWERNTELIRKIKRQVRTYLSSKAAGVGDIPKDLEQVYVERRNKEIEDQKAYEEKINTPGGLGTKNPVQTAESTGYNIRHKLSPEARGPSDRFALRQSLSGQPEEVDLDKRIADAEKDAELLSRLEENQKRRNELYEEEARMGRKTHIETANEKRQTLNPVGAPGERPTPTRTPEYVPLDEDEKNLQFKMKQSVKDLNDAHDVVKTARQEVLDAQKVVKDLEATLGSAAKKTKPGIKAQIETASQASDKAIQDLKELEKEEKEAFVVYKNLEKQYNELTETKKSARANQPPEMTPAQRAMVEATARADAEAREKTERANKVERDRVRSGEVSINQERTQSVLSGAIPGKLKDPYLSRSRGVIFDPTVVESAKKVSAVMDELGISYAKAIQIVDAKASPELKKQQQLWIGIQKAISDATKAASKQVVDNTKLENQAQTAVAKVDKSEVSLLQKRTARYWKSATDKKKAADADEKVSTQAQNSLIKADNSETKLVQKRTAGYWKGVTDKKKAADEDEKVRVQAQGSLVKLDNSEAKLQSGRSSRYLKGVDDAKKANEKEFANGRKFAVMRINAEKEDDKFDDNRAKKKIKLAKEVVKAGEKAAKDVLKSNELNTSKQGEESFGLAFGGFELRFAGQQMAMAAKQMLLPMERFAQTFGELNATSSDWLQSQKLLNTSISSLGESLAREALPTLKLVIGMVDSIAQFLKDNPAVARLAVTAGAGMYIIGQTLATIGALMTSVAALKFAVPMGANILGITLPETVETARKVAAAKTTAMIEVVGATKAAAILNAGATTAAATLARGAVVAAATENTGAAAETAIEVNGAIAEEAIEAGISGASGAVKAGTNVAETVLAAQVAKTIFKGASFVEIVKPIVKLLPYAAIAAAVVGAAGTAWDWLGKNTQRGKEQNMEAAPGQLATVLAKWAGDFVTAGLTKGIGQPTDPTRGNEWAKAVGAMTGALKEDTKALEDRTTAEARKNIEMSAVTEYINYMKQINESEKKHGKERKSLIDDYLKAIVEKEKKYGDDLKKLDDEATKIRNGTTDEDKDARDSRAKAMEAYALDEKRAYEDYYRDRLLSARDYGTDVERAEQDHQDKMREMTEDHNLKVLDLLYENDAFGLLAEQRSFEKERRQAEQEFAKDSSRKSEDQRTKEADAAAAFALERQRAAEDFAIRMQDEDKQKAVEKERKLKDIEDKKAELIKEHNDELAQMKADQDDKLKAMDDAHVEEMNTLRQDFTDRLRDLNAALLGEQMMKQEYYKAMQTDLKTWLENMDGTFSSSLPNWPKKKAAGGYLTNGIYHAGEAGYEFLLDHQATKEAERAVGGQLTQQNILRGSRSGASSVTVHQNFRFDGPLSADQKAWYRRAAREESINGLSDALRN